MREFFLSLPEKSFLIKAAAESKRLDGRTPDDFRDFQVNFGRDWGSCLVTLGETKVLSNVSCEVQEPRATRPNDGLLYINVELSGMAAPHLETGNKTELGVHLSRMLEKCLKESKAVDLEALCLVADEKVWALRVDVNVLNHEGNLVDCCAIAALASLAHFRRPDVTTDGQEIVIHDPSERDPLPTTLHHYPVCVSFAYMAEGDKILSDPTDSEQQVADAELVFGINSFREVCALHLGGSSVLHPRQIMRCANKAALRAKQLVEKIKKSMEEDLMNRLTGRPIGFANSFETGKITSYSQEKVKIQLNKFRLGHPLEISESPDVPMKEEPVLEEKMEIEEAEVQVVSLGDNTAELAPVLPPKRQKKAVAAKAPKYGEGGPSQWIVETDTIPVVSIDDTDITALTVPPRKKLQQPNAEDSDDEEEVHVLQSHDLEKAECVNSSSSQHNPTQQRQQKLQKQHFNKKKYKKGR